MAANPKPTRNPLPSSPLSSFIYRAAFLCILLFLLPLFPPQFSDSANNTVLARILELLQLLVVGIAISYGLFSRKNPEPELDKDNQPKSDTEILGVLSVFEDEEVTESVDLHSSYSQYKLEEPAVVTKPLFLPVRSLKNVQGENVLPSPIPWRSRSGRMEVRKEEDMDSKTFPSSRMSSETISKTSEDLGRRKSFVRSSPPPAPPPPPPLPSSHAYNLVRENQAARKSFKDELENLSIRKMQPPVGKSVRTARAQEVKLPRKRREKNEFREKMIIESDSSDSDGDDESERFEAEDLSESAPEENEVDKKADEFIAKFREQIRLQRIDAIKKSTQQKSIRSET